MTLEADFLTTAADKLVENLDRIETCLTELPLRSLWARDSENENAVGNLLLHLEGNVRQWILSTIILLTKRFTGKDLGFYSYLDETGRREIPEDQPS